MDAEEEKLHLLNFPSAWFEDAWTSTCLVFPGLRDATLATSLGLTSDTVDYQAYSLRRTASLTNNFPVVTTFIRSRSSRCHGDEGVREGSAKGSLLDASPFESIR